MGSDFDGMNFAEFVDTPTGKPMPTPFDNDFAEPAPPAAPAHEGEDLSIDQAIEQALGITAAELKEAVSFTREMKQNIREGQEAQSFIEAHPQDFHPCPENYREMKSLLDAHNLPLTKENLERAFVTLKQAGRLTPPPASRPQSSGLSDRHYAPLPLAPARKQDSEADLSAELAGMSLDDARNLIARKMYERRTQQNGGGY